MRHSLSGNPGTVYFHWSENLGSPRWSFFLAYHMPSLTASLRAIGKPDQARDIGPVKASSMYHAPARLTRQNRNTQLESLFCRCYRRTKICAVTMWGVLRVFSAPTTSDIRPRCCVNFCSMWPIFIFPKEILILDVRCIELNHILLYLGIILDPKHAKFRGLRPHSGYIIHSSVMNYMARILNVYFVFCIVFLSSICDSNNIMPSQPKNFVLIIRGA